MGTAVKQFWLAYLDLGCALLAAALWYLSSTIGPWPLLIALIPWGVRLLGRRPLVLTPYALPLLLFVVTAGLSLWAAYDPAAAWPKFWRIIGALLLFYATAHGLRAGLRPAVYGWLLAAMGVALSLYFGWTNDWTARPGYFPALAALGQWGQAWLPPPAAAHRLNPNVAGGMLAFALPFTLMTLFSPAPARRWLALALSGSALLVTAGGLLASSSRGAWLALLAAAGLAGLWLLLGLVAPAPARRRWLFLATVTAGVALLIFLFSRPAAGPWLLQLGWDPVRLAVLQDSLLLAQDYPFIGAGLDGFMMLHVSYAMLLHVGYIVHSHNLFLNVAIEQGGVALLLLISLWLIFGQQLWQQAGAGGGHRWLAAAALALVTLLAHGLVDDVFYGSRALLLLFLPLAFTVRPATVRLAGQAPDAPLTAGRRRWLGLGAVLFLVLLLAGWQQQTLRARWYANLAAVAQSRAELAVYRWPDWPLQDAVRRELDLTTPLANYRRALALDPQLVSAHRRQGQILLSLGDYEAAWGHLAAAYAAQPWANATRQLYGEALIVNGQVAEGAALWATVLNQQNQLAARAFWYQHIGDGQRAQWIREALPGR